MIKLGAGEYAPYTGTYSVVDANGTRQYTIEATRGEKLPNTSNSTLHYEFDENN